MNFDFKTFVGPTFSSPITIEDDSNRRGGDPDPIWKVNETFDPKNYFEMRTKYAELSITSLTPATCSSDGKLLK